MLADVAVTALTAAGLLLGPLLGGTLSSFTMRSSLHGWYPAQRKPALQPPPWVFGPVWTTLYLALGYSSLRVYSISPEALYPYYINMGLNMLWTPLFFGLKSPGLALLDLLGVLGTGAWTLREWSSIGDMIALGGFGAYMAWCSFAMYLNAGAWWLNRGRVYVAVKEDDDESR